MVAENGSADRYGILVYKDIPVADQKRVGDDIQVIFCNGKTVYVDPKDWVAQKRFVFVSKSHGTREHIVKNWRKYRTYSVTSN